MKYHHRRRRRAYELKVDPAFIDLIYRDVEEHTASLCDVSVVAGERRAMCLRLELSYASFLTPSCLSEWCLAPEDVETAKKSGGTAKVRDVLGVKRGVWSR